MSRNQAAGYLNVSAATVGGWARDGYLPFVRVSEKKTTAYGFRIADLDAVAMSKRKRNDYWDKDAEELPKEVFNRVVGLNNDARVRYLSMGVIRDRTPKSARVIIRRLYKNELMVEIRNDYLTKISRLRFEITRLRGVIKDAKCEKCNGILRKLRKQRKSGPDADDGPK